jgi:hypothetical protein
MQSQSKTVKDYLRELPEDRRTAISAVRETILKNLQSGFEEGMQYGMIGYYVPHSIYPAGYHCDPKQPVPFACLASQKNYMSLYLLSSYSGAGEEQWLREQFAKAGKKLDMGKSCVRFKKLEDLPLSVVGEAIRRVSVASYIAAYEAALDAPRPAKKAATSKTKSAKSPATAKTAKKAVAPKKAAKKKSSRTK